MRTNYSTGTFAQSYANSRALGDEVVAAWAATLSSLMPVAPDGLVLDIGAGTGRFWPVFDAAWKPRRIVAVDRSIEMLRRGQTDEAGPEVTRVVGDIDAIPVAPTGDFDVVFCSMVLHYSAAPAECLRALCSRLRPDGFLCVRTGTQETLSSFDFLRFFPTALAAERDAMPGPAQLADWTAVEEVRIVTLDEVAVGSSVARARALRKVLARGFPSLQLVPTGEFMVGVVRYAAHLLGAWVRREPRPIERSVLVIARRRDSAPSPPPGQVVAEI